MLHNLLALPPGLRARPQWVLWRMEQHNSRLTKVPYSTSGCHARTNAPTTWSSFEHALTFYRRNHRRFSGLGYVFSAGDGFCGIDLDECHSEPWALDIVGALDSYTERSPSGRGFHVITRAALPPGSRCRGKIQMYESTRYFTMTGDHWPGTPLVVEDRQAEIDALHARIFDLTQFQPARQPIRQLARQARQSLPTTSDTDLLTQALGAQNGAKFARLFGGDFSGYPSQSEADLALCNILAFWTDYDALRVDQLFRQSGLYRPKWDERHYADGRTYGQATAAKACLPW